MNRRHFLRNTGITVALPMLESLMPRAIAASVAAASSPKRMVLINASMGLLPKEFFPEGAGKGYKMSNYLSEFEDLRQKFSVFSGLSHPEVDGGHHADFCFLTGRESSGWQRFQKHHLARSVCGGANRYSHPGALAGAARWCGVTQVRPVLDFVWRECSGGR